MLSSCIFINKCCILISKGSIQIGKHHSSHVLLCNLVYIGTLISHTNLHAIIKSLCNRPFHIKIVVPNKAQAAGRANKSNSFACQKICCLHHGIYNLLSRKAMGYKFCRSHKGFLLKLTSFWIEST